MIGIRVFTVNKNKGWQADNYAGMRTAVVLFFCVSRLGPFTPQKRIVTLKRVNHLLEANVGQG